MCLHLYIVVYILCMCQWESHKNNLHPPCLHFLILQTFPGDKVNRVQYLSPSATPSPVRITPSSSVTTHPVPSTATGGQELNPNPAAVSPSGSISGSVLSSGGSGSASGGRRTVQRKVLRLVPDALYLHHTLSTCAMRGVKVPGSV